jgi:hypothetical protein
MGGACCTYEGEEKCIQDFGVEMLGKQTTWKTQGRWEANRKMDLQEVGCGGMD